MPEFKIDRSQRIHHDGMVVRAYQVFDTMRFGWDTNRELQPSDASLHASLDAAEHAADAARVQQGHVCDERCYEWRPLM